MPKKSTSTTEFLALSDAEKGHAVAEFDREFAVDEFQPLTPAQRRRWQRAKRPPGRPRVGAGAKRVMVSIESGLLAQVDRLAKKRRISRSQLITAGLRAQLAHARAPRRKQVA